MIRHSPSVNAEEPPRSSPVCPASPLPGCLDTRIQNLSAQIEFEEALPSFGARRSPPIMSLGRSYSPLGDSSNIRGSGFSDEEGSTTRSNSNTPSSFSQEEGRPPRFIDNSPLLANTNNNMRGIGFPNEEGLTRRNSSNTPSPFSLVRRSPGTRAPSPLADPNNMG